MKSNHITYSCTTTHFSFLNGFPARAEIRWETTTTTSFLPSGTDKWMRKKECYSSWHGSSFEHCFVLQEKSWVWHSRLLGNGTHGFYSCVHRRCFVSKLLFYPSAGLWYRFVNGDEGFQKWSILFSWNVCMFVRDLGGNVSWASSLGWCRNSARSPRSAASL